MSAQERHILVIGAGILGLSSAWYLLERGARVTILDREPIRDAASCGNAGLISLGHPPLTRPGVSIQGLKWMFDKRSPLYIKPRLDGDLARWLWTFHRHCTRSHYEGTMEVLCELGRLSADCFESILAETAIDCDWQRRGWDDVCLHESSLDHAEEEAGLLARFGFHSERVDGDTLRAEAPAYTDAVRGAIRFEDSATLSPQAFTAGLARELEARGATIRTDCTVETILLRGDRVEGVRLEDGEELTAEATVLAAGVWSDQLARAIGLRIPMQPARGYHRDLVGLESMPPRGCVLNETFIAVSPFHDTLRLAGTLELSGFDAPWLDDRLAHLTTAGSRYLRGVDTATVTQEWAGYRPCTADGMPVVGAVPRRPGLYVGTGHAMMGMTLGPASGRLIAEAIYEQAPALDSPLLAAARY
ncbi:MAG: FAD-dependent oxidoreductase [Planctomycetota bacterium]|nr:FAD-dependent oxidoreductase [Planctomycetota bacterium]